jgi:hypothetical protein
MTQSLEHLGPDVYVVNGEVKIPGAKLPVRMTVLRLADQSLLLHSPIALEPAVVQELQQLGQVRWVVAPTIMHHLFVRDVMTLFSSAKLLAVQGLSSKLAGLTAEGSLAASTPVLAEQGLDVLPVDGMPSLNESVFFHRSSQTLIVSDLLFNVVSSPYFATRMLLTVASGVYGRCAVSRLVRWAVKDKAACTESLKRVIALAPTRLVMAHGDVLSVDVAQTVERELKTLF